MFENEAIRLTGQALYLVLILSGPPIIAASVVGLLVALIQAATQVQEQSFQYMVKFIAVVVALFFSAAFLGGTLLTFANHIFENMPSLVR